MMPVITRYTDTLDVAQKRLVQSIPGVEENCIRSSFLTTDPDDDGWTGWLEAWQEPGEEGQPPLWTVKRQTMHLGTGQGQQESLFSYACFFDALHHISKFEAAEKLKGARVIDAHQSLPADDMHYLVAAEKTHQPLNAKAIVYPAAQGRILADGVFDLEARERAKRTRHVALTPVKMTGSSLHSMLTGPVPSGTAVIPAESAGALSSPSKKQELMTAFNDACTTAKGMLEITENIVKQSSTKQVTGLYDKISVPVYASATISFAALGYSNTGSIGLALLAGLLSSAVGAVVYMGGLPFIDYDGFIVQKELRDRSEKLQRQVQHLPDSELKTMLLDFSRAAVTTGLMESAAYRQKRYKETGKQRHLNKGLKRVERAGRFEGLPDTNIRQLKDSFAAQKELTPGAFHVKLARQLAAINEAQTSFNQNVLEGPA